MSEERENEIQDTAENMQSMMQEEYLKSLDGIEYLTELTNLTGKNCKLKKLDLSGNPALSDVNCNGNFITEVNLSNNADLSGLSLDNNKISSTVLFQIFHDLVMICVISVEMPAVHADTLRSLHIILKIIDKKALFRLFIVGFKKFFVYRLIRFCKTHSAGENSSKEYRNKVKRMGTAVQHML